MRDATPSATARLIAAATLLLHATPAARSAVPPDAVRWCRVLLASRWQDRLLALSAESRSTRWLWWCIERVTLPGIVEHYWHRKRHIEARCRDALASGVQRVVVAGAGFDTLALRLAPEYPEVEFVEIDHPATQAAKCIALQSHAGARRLARNLRFVACDLAADGVPRAAMDERVRTLVIAEGLLMYLVEDTVARHLREWAARMAPGSRVLFTFMQRWPDGRAGFRPYSRWIDAWLASRGEPFRWAVKPEHAAQIAGDAGLDLMECVGTRELSLRARTVPLDGEWVALCERS
jgi:methyltransferase (TIGR00027 family)